MEVAYVSDLHLESLRGASPVEIDADLLVLAGDIATYSTRDQIFIYLSKCVGSFKYVIFVLGNHEYYDENFTYRELRRKWREWCEEVGIFLLDDSCVEIEGKKIIGSTLWTDLNEGHAARRVEFALSTYSKIRNFSALTSYYIHQESRKFLYEAFASNSIDLCITHYCPIFIEHTRYPANDITYGFCCTGMEELVRDSKQWIYGHTHDNKKVLDNLHTNQYGYYYAQEENFSTVAKIRI